jgi:hypothetical protein
MRFSSLQIATIDVASGRISVFAPFPHAPHNINPQFTPDGRDLFFISDQDGVPDIYRLALASGEVRRITRMTTGISGITSFSPALSVAQRNGRVVFTVFQGQGFQVRGIELAAATGEPVVPGTQAQIAAASVLPPGDVTRSVVTTYLSSPAEGLVSGTDFRVVPYRPSFQLDALGQPSIGVVAGGPFGTGVAGGVSAYFGDQLSDQQISSAIQANGTVRDIGGAVYYYNLKRRWNYGLGLEHVPYLTGGVFYDTATVGGGLPAYSVNQVLQRIYIDQASFMTQYPFSQSRRFEVNASLTRLGFQREVDQFVVLQQTGQIVTQERKNLPAPRPIYYASPTVALVGDQSFAAFTSPVAGSRYRLEYSPTIGTLKFQTLLADYRKYIFLRPFTFAMRGMYYARYGADAENGQLSPLYLGEETLLRGYGYGSIDASECTGATAQGSCPVFDRMFGSRIGVASFEFRIPLFGTSEFGLLNFPFLPTEISPFFDAGIAYTSTQHPDFRFTEAPTNIISADCQRGQQSDLNTLPIACAQRIPVFSTGVSARINFLGYMILEAYAAHPFQRPAKNWVFGFQLAPGW